MYLWPSLPTALEVRPSYKGVKTTAQLYRSGTGNIELLSVFLVVTQDLDLDPRARTLPGPGATM